MKDYQISYYSPQGHAKDLALAFKQLLPSLTPLLDLQKDTFYRAKTHIVGFEFSGTTVDRIPSEIQMFLSELSGSDVIVYATTPLCIDGEIQERAEEILYTCLPEKCRYRGFFLCQGEASSQVIRELQNSICKEPDNKEYRDILRMCRSSKLHPTRQDIRLGCRFMADKLCLEYY